MLSFRFAQLSAEQLNRVQDLERELGNVFLIAMVDLSDIGPALEPKYILEAKVDYDDWRPVDSVLNEVPAAYLLSRFSSKADAHACKTRLKNFLNSTRYEGPKYPIRIRALP